MSYASSRRGDEEYEQADRDTIRLLSRRHGDHGDDQQEQPLDDDSMLSIDEAEEAPRHR